MAYAFIQEMPATKDMYLSISDKIGDEIPKGLIVHLAFETKTGMRIVDLWESEEDFDRFGEQRLHAALEKTMQDAGVTRESMGQPKQEDVTPVEVFGAQIAKQRF